MTIATKRWFCFVLALIPLGTLVWKFITNDLGIDPYDTLIRTSGEQALVFLMLSLTITPLISIKYLAKKQLVIYKKPIGLVAFGYSLVHFLIFLTFDLQYNLVELTRIIAEKPYILVGFSSFIILLALAITSLTFFTYKLGGKNWKKIHQLVYLAITFAILHFLWLSKTLQLEFWVYTSVVIFLLGFRIYKFIKVKYKQIKT